MYGSLSRIGFLHHASVRWSVSLRGSDWLGIVPEHPLLSVNVTSIAPMARTGGPGGGSRDTLPLSCLDFLIKMGGSTTTSHDPILQTALCVSFVLFYTVHIWLYGCRLTGTTCRPGDFPPLTFFDIIQ